MIKKNRIDPHFLFKRNLSKENRCSQTFNERAGEMLEEEENCGSETAKK